MGAKSGIEWTDATWNATRGCTRVSEGCRNCYAERQAYRFSGPGQPYEGLVELRNGRPAWTGQVRLVEDALMLPLHWRKPRRIFVNSMSDLFHEGLTGAEIDRVFAVMALCPQHTFQVLTKRPERMAEFLGVPEGELGERWCYAAAKLLGRLPPPGRDFPLSNVWEGFSAEDQPSFDQRWAAFQGTPAAVTMVSLEPLLGGIVLPHDFLALGSRAWVIVGGESGPGARPAHPDWFRRVRDQCAAAGVSFFMKQITERGRKVPFEAWPRDMQIREYPNATL